MAKETDNTSTPEYDRFAEGFNKREKLEELAEKASHLNPKIRVEAQDEKAKKAYDLGVEQGYVDKDRIKSSTDLPSEEREQLYKVLQSQTMLDSAAYFSNPTNLEKIIRQIPKKTIESILEDQNAAGIIISKTEREEREALLAYAALKETEKFVNDYRGGKNLTEEQRKAVIEIAIEGAVTEAEKKEKTRQQAAGYEVVDKEAVKLAGSLTERSIKVGLVGEKRIKEYAEMGLREQLEKIKKEYEDKGIDATEVIRSSIYKLAQSSNPNEHLAAMQLAYKGKLERRE